jgi:exodeoxyribonuclease-5
MPLIKNDLTEHQQEAFDEVYGHLVDGEPFVGLQGYAGTGKTYLVCKLVDQLLEEDANVTVCAPTHKSVQVLSQELGDTPVEMQTIHSFLGLRLEPDGEGGYELVPDDAERDIADGIVVVDEASMIGTEEWKYIEAIAQPDLEHNRVQWVLVGDPAQLPPVNEDPSPALRVEKRGTLTEVHRQAEDNPILDLATQVREGTVERFSSQYADGKGVAITHNREPFLESILRTFQSDAFEQDPTHARVLAYRNRTVRRYNREIRRSLYGADAPRFEEGEWIVARETWFHDGASVLTNSEEVRVKKASVTTFEAEDLAEWKVWKLKVRTPGRGLTRTALVLHEDEHERYENELETRRERALDNPGDWQRYYDLRERFARVDYAYATTVHKAQGSTFDTVFVDQRDLRACRGDERRALLYVAVTRPSRRLALLV